MAQRRSGDTSEAELRLELLRPALEAAYGQASEELKKRPSQEPPGVMVPFMRFRKFPAAALKAAEQALESEEFRERVADGTAKSLAGPARLVLTQPDGWQDTLGSFVAMELEVAAEAAESTEMQALSGRLEAVEQAAVEASVARDDALELQSAAEAERDLERLTSQATQQELEEAEASVLELQRRISELSQRATRAEQNLGAERTKVKSLEQDLLEAASLSAEVVLSAAMPVDQDPTVSEPPLAPDPQAQAIDRDHLAKTMAAASQAAAEMSRALTEMSRIVEMPEVEPLQFVTPDVAAARRQQVVRRIAKPLPRAMLEDSDEATDYLLRLEGLELFVDGYNVTLAAWPHMQLPEQRSRLIRALTTICASTKASVRVVFDGAEGDWLPELPARCPVLVQFAPPDIEADDIILEHLSRLGPETPVAVVSSDRRVQAGARKLGAYVISSEQMRRRL